MARRLMFAPLLAVLSASPLLAATDLELLQKSVRKYALTNSLDPPRRSPCVCQDGGANHGSAGVVTEAGITNGKILVTCFVRIHNAAGAVSSTSPCITFEVLAK